MGASCSRVQIDLVFSCKFKIRYTERSLTWEQQ